MIFPESRLFKIRLPMKIDMYQDLVRRTKGLNMMRQRKLKSGRLKILRSQAKQLETLAQNTTFEGAESLEEQYFRLRDNLVSIDPEADKILPDSRRVRHVGGFTVDFNEKLIEMRIAIGQLNAYLDAFETERVEADTSTCEELLVPNEVLDSLPREVGRTIKGVCHNYRGGFIDFCFWGMRKALIDAIRIRFTRDRKEKMLYDKERTPYSLSRWIELATQQGYISSHIAKDLNSQVKVFGDVASHDYMANLQKEEVRPVMTSLRMTLSRMYYQKNQESEDSK